MPGKFSKLLGLFTAQTRYRLTVGMLLYPTDCIFTTAGNPKARGSGNGGHRVLGWRGLCVLGEGDTAELPAHVSSETRALCPTLFNSSVFFPSSTPFLPLSHLCPILHQATSKQRTCHQFAKSWSSIRSPRGDRSLGFCSSSAITGSSGSRGKSLSPVEPTLLL